MRGYVSRGVTEEDKRCIKCLVVHINQPQDYWVDVTIKKWWFFDSTVVKLKGVGADKWKWLVNFGEGHHCVENRKLSKAVLTLDNLYSGGSTEALLDPFLAKTLTGLQEDFRSETKPYWGLIGEFDNKEVI